MAISDAPVTISVVVPVLGEPQDVAGVLEALTQVRAPAGGFEVIISDDGSPVPFDEVVARYRDRLDITLVRNRQAGPGAARNAGAAVARGAWLAFVDADCRPAHDWLLTFEAAFARHPDALLGGRTRNGVEDNVYSATSMLILDAVYRFYNADLTQARFCPSSNLAVPRAPFLAMGGFDDAHFPLASEDRDLCDRWRHLGKPMVYLPDASVRHLDALTFTRFVRQNFEYGRGAWRYRDARAQRRSGMFREDAGFHARLPHLMREPLASLPRPQRVPVFLLLLVWQCANALGFIAQALGWGAQRHGAIRHGAAGTAPPYAYRCTDNSWLTAVLSTRVAPVVESWLPKAWSANDVTVLGSVLMWILLGALLLMEPAARGHLAPLWVALLWSYCILDHVDGCRARRRASSSAFGEFLDHSLDSWHGAIAVIAVGLIADHAISWPIVGLAMACVSLATTAIWLEQKARGEFILGAVGPVEAVVAVGLFFLLMGNPVTASILRAPVVASSDITWAAVVLMGGSVATGFATIAGIQRTRAILRPLARFALASGVLLGLGMAGQVEWAITLAAIALMTGDYSARVITSHLTGGDTPAPDLVVPVTLMVATVAGIHGQIIPLGALVWLGGRVMLAYRAAARALMRVRPMTAPVPESHMTASDAASLSVESTS